MTDEALKHDRKWRFYGRGNDIERLQGLLRLDREPAARRFSAFGLRGRRGVGKTELVKETLRRHGGDTPILFLEMRSGQQANPQVFLQTVRDELSVQGQSSLLDSQPPQRPDCSDDRYFVEALHHLLRHDQIVVLDEFHNCRETGVPHELKIMIDEHRRQLKQGKQKLKGRLLVMGSHQQKFQNMFADDQPLYQRISIKMKVQPWPLSTIMTVAREQGWDLHPARLHTLWTAYGGLPFLWERLVMDDDVPAHLRQWPDANDDPPADERERQWRMDLLAFERWCIEEDDRLAWDSRITIEIKEPMRATLMEMGHARNAGRMTPIATLVRNHNQVIEDQEETSETPIGSKGLYTRLCRLQRQTGLIEHQIDFSGLHPSDRSSVWRLADPHTLFQIRTMGDMVSPTMAAQIQHKTMTDALQRLESLEGEQLEQLTVTWLREHPEWGWGFAGALPPSSDKMPRKKARDIDILVRLGNGRADDLLILGNAKRDPDDHKPTDFKRIVNAFMKAAPRDPVIAGIQHLPRLYMAVSPRMDEASRAHLQTAGMMPVDLNDMQVAMATGWADLDRRWDIVRPEPTTVASAGPKPDPEPTLGQVRNRIMKIRRAQKATPEQQDYIRDIIGHDPIPNMTQGQASDWIDAHQQAQPATEEQLRQLAELQKNVDSRATPSRATTDPMKP